jgi:hypothetical protein
MKRSKPRSFGSRDSAEAETGLGAKKIEPPKVWADEVAPKDDANFTAYAPTGRFAKGALLLHPRFGKGLVVGVEGARLEVLFEDGVKKLGHSG